MSRRLVVTAWLLLTALGTAIPGFLSAGFLTTGGNSLLTRLAVAELSGALHGTAQVDSITGSVVEGLDAWNLVVHDDSGEVFARLPRVTIRYRALDLVSGRVVLGRVVLEDPFINLLKRRNGRFNYQDVLGLGGPGGGGPSPLVAFREAEIRNATVVLRTPSEAPSASDDFVVEDGPDGLVRVRHIEGLTARLPYARVASPFPGESGLRFDIEELSARFTDPAVDIRDLAGRLEIDGSTMTVNVERLRLPSTLVSVTGAISWPNGPPLFALEIEGEQIAANDARWIADKLPWGMAGSATVSVQSIGPDSLRLRLQDMALRAGRDGGAVAGDFGALFGNGEMLRLEDTELRLDELDLDYVLPIFDSLPFRGRLSGRVAADGPLNLLSTELDWRFRDSLAAEAIGVFHAPDDSLQVIALPSGTIGADSIARAARRWSWPVTDVAGRGVLALGGPETLVFYQFGVDDADVDLATVRRMTPAVELQGRLGASGTLNGAWQNVEFAGTLTHRDGDLPTSKATGIVLLDSRRDTVGVFADLAFDSLQLAGVQPSYPQLPAVGVLAGDVHLAGFTDSLAFEGDFSGPHGIIRGTAVFTLLPGRLAARALDAEFTRLDVAGFRSGATQTELYGRVLGDVAADSTEPARGRFSVVMDTSYIADAPIDSVSGSVEFADGLFETDGLWMWGPHLVVSANGGFGLDSTQSGTLRVAMVSDSLAVVEPAARALVSIGERYRLLTDLDGEVSAEFTLSGSQSQFEASVVVASEVMESQRVWAEGLELRGEWESAVGGAMQVTGSLDSLSVDRQAYSDLRFTTEGTKNAARWFARARIGLDGSAIGWGQLYTDPNVAVVPIDSVRLLLPTAVWRLDPGALVSVSDSGIVFRNFTMLSDDEGRSVDITGLLPTNGAGDLRGSIAQLPVRDMWAMAQLDPSSADGELSGRFVVRGTGNAPTFDASLALIGGRFGNVRFPVVLGTAEYRNRRLTGDYRLQRAGDTLMTLSMDLPLDLALERVERRRLPGPLSLRAVADGVDLAFVDLFTRNARDATGEMDANFGIAGTWEQPELTGAIEISDGAARFPPLGVAYRNINGSIVLAGDTIRLDRLVAESGGGRVAASGYMRLEGLRQPRMNFAITANQFDAIDVPGFVTMTSSAQLALTGPVFGATLAGTGTITEGVLYFADLIEKDIINLEDSLYASLDPSLIQTIKREGLGADFENRFLDSLTIASLELTMGASVWLRSNEANVQLDGVVTVSKVREQYRNEGTLNTPRGTYRLPLAGSGKDFAVTGGDVQFFGTPDLNAAIDINARHVVRTVRDDNLTVFVNVGGTLYEPILSLTSDNDPPLPEAEIISYLLFGSPSFELGGDDRARRQLGAAVTEVFSIGGTALLGEFSTQLERALIADLGVPVDYLQIRSSTALRGISDVQISVGWRIGENTFVTLSPRLCGSEFQNPGLDDLYPSVEQRLSRSWRFSFSVDPGTPCGAFGGRLQNPLTQIGTDLFWEKRY